MKAQLKKYKQKQFLIHMFSSMTVCVDWAYDRNCLISFWRGIEHVVSGVIVILQQESSL